MSRFFSGVGMLLRGFGFWRRRPEVMLLGLIPAAIVFLVVLAALIALGLSLPGLTEWLTPFADEWDDPWPALVRGAIGAIVLAAAVVLAAVTFTALTLAVGDPFYERIWRAVELDLGGEVPEHGAGLWRSILDSGRLIAIGLLTAMGVAATGLIPIIGAVLAPTLGVILSGRLLAMELTSRAFEARGIRSTARRSVLRGRGAELLGFGVATQLLFMVPLGAIFTMPAAVAGSTMLARSALDAAGAAAAPAEPTPPTPLTPPLG